MNTLETRIKNYIEYCTAQKRLDTKTLKAYKIDLRQFSEQISITEIEYITTSVLESYITNLHQQYSPKSVKRKIASIKAFFHYLEYKDIIILNPFNKLQIKFREPVILPKTIPLKTLEVLFNAAYAKYHKTTSLQFTTPSGLHSVLERPFSEANGRPFLVKRSPLIVC